MRPDRGEVRDHDVDLCGSRLVTGGGGFGRTVVVHRRTQCPGVDTSTGREEFRGGRSEHGSKIEGRRQRRVRGVSTSGQAGRRRTYPTPRIVWITIGFSGSGSIAERSQWTWTSTVRVSPA